VERMPAVLLSALILRWAAFGAQSPTSYQEVATGCYDLIATAFPDSLPALIHLTDLPDSAFRHPEAKTAEAFGDTLGRSRWPLGYTLHGRWRHQSQDTVQVWWDNGFSGTFFEARLAGDSLVGRANSFSDRVVIGATIPTYAAVFRRHPCPG
jgi:hypothetical protein